MVEKQRPRLAGERQKPEGVWSGGRGISWACSSVVERSLRMREIGGSNPPGSIQYICIQRELEI